MCFFVHSITVQNHQINMLVSGIGKSVGISCCPGNARRNVAFVMEFDDAFHSDGKLPGISLKHKFA